MSVVTAHRNTVTLRRPLLACCTTLLALSACGHAETPGVRGVVPLVPVDGALPALSTLTPELDQALDVLLKPREQHVTELALFAGRRYTVELRYRGARPMLRDVSLTEDPGGSEAPSTAVRTALLPGEPEPGLERGILRPTSNHLRLEIVGAEGETQLEHLLVRRWGSAGALTLDETTGWRALGVYGDYRVGTVLEPSQVLHWDAVVPAGATALAFEIASDPTRPEEDVSPENVQLLMELTPVGASGRGEVALPLGSARTAWQPATFDLTGPLSVEAGQRVRLTLQSRSADGSGAPEDVYVSAPVWHCTDGPRRPNLVLISLDTTRPDHLGLYGYGRDTSPNIDALAEQSVVFDAAQSTAPYTLPAHATMFSGQYPSTHGAEHPAHALDPDRTPLLAALLADAGYATRAFTGGGYLNGDYGFAHGFGAYSNNDPVDALDGQRVSEVQGSAAGREYVEALTAQHWSAALGWIERTKDVPFFLFIQTFAIHDYRPDGRHRELFGAPAWGEGVVPGRTPPEQLEQPYTAEEIAQLMALYDGAIHEVDALVGDLSATLQRLGIAGDTIVVVIADHGEEFAEHHIDGQPFVGHGQGLWQTLLHVPLVVHVPWLEPRRIAERVSTVDLAPTLLDLLGVAAPAAMQGRSLRPLLETGAGSVSPVVSELHSNRGAMRSLIAGDLKVVTGDPDALVSWPVPAPVQLFNLATDPVEDDDWASEQPAIASGLAEVLTVFGLSLEDQRAAKPQEADLSEETRRRLEELGYVDG